jgi:hypothetical protein
MKLITLTKVCRGSGKRLSCMSRVLMIGHRLSRFNFSARRGGSSAQPFHKTDQANR